MELQFITHHTDTLSYLDSARLALEGGCRWIQLRMKEAPRPLLEATARQLLPLCRSRHATLIIDDDVELALAVGADGVHLGRHDMPIAQARALLGSRFIIGGTANTFEDVKAHATAGADYIGCGPYRYTTTKQNLSPVLGLEGYTRILRQMERAGIRLPLVAIGGIEPADIPPLLAAGVDGIALSGTILRADDPVRQTQDILRLTQAGRPLPKQPK